MTDVEAAPEHVVGESRWPMAIAVLALMGATVVGSSGAAGGLVWAIAGIEGVLLAALIVGDPGRIDRRTPWLRRTGFLLVAFLIGTALIGTAILIVDLVNGAAITSNPKTLLIAGAKVWLTNNVAFALLYWQFDGGGPAERAHGLPRYPDFAFPQLSSPELAPPDWRPRFIDYLYIGFTNANAFSPTDALPLTGKAKMAMQVQALISYTILALALARVINVFT